jgi:hypothetical protein
MLFSCNNNGAGFKFKVGLTSRAFGEYPKFPILFGGAAPDLGPTVGQTVEESQSQAQRQLHR